MSKRISCFAVVLALFMVVCNVCYAITPRASEIIAGKQIDSAAVGGGRVEFTARIYAYGIMDKLGCDLIRIEEYYENSWHTVKTVYSRYGYEVGSYSYTTGYDGVAGRDYRAYVEFYAKDGSIIDTKTLSTSGITAR